MRSPLLDDPQPTPARLTERAERVLAVAKDAAQHLGHTSAGTDHILFALLNEWEGPHVPILRELLKNSGHADLLAVARWVHSRLVRIGQGDVIDGQAAEVDQLNLIEGEVVE